MIKFFSTTILFAVSYLIGFEIIKAIPIDPAIKLPIYIGFIFLILSGYVKIVQRFNLINP